MTLSPGTKLGRYEICSKLGEGGMGEVYLAQDTKLERTVALKTLPAEVADHRQRMQRFMQEAKTASSLNHPNILTIFEIGEWEGTHFIATEFIDGETLRQHIQLTHANIGDILGFVIQVADALAAAHEAGIVHRDIKPDNIMIRRRDGYVKVLDFGLAKLTQTDKSLIDPNAPTKALIATDPGVVMGTVQYMSPEQARGQPLDARTDIFSLGVILYEMLAGRPPFEGKTKSDLVAAILGSEPPPLARYAREVPETLEWIVTKALRKDKEERYQTAKELLTDLRSLKVRLEFAVEQARSLPPGVKSEPISAGQSGRASIEAASGQAGQTDKSGTAPLPSSAEFLVREAKRHKLGVALALSAVILLIVGAALGLKYLGRSTPKVEPFSKIKPTRLTFTGKVRTAAISPDGKYVVYAMAESGKHSLWLRQVDLASQQQIAAPAELEYQQLLFSRDGKWLYYVVRDRNSPTNVLYQMAALGGPARRLMTNVTPITLSPDGQRIAFVRDFGSEGEDRLMVANADGSGEARKLSARRYPDFFPNTTTPAWSPDGNRIACVVMNAVDRQATVAEVPAAGGVTTPMTAQRWSAVYALAWLTDGKGLVVLASDQETTNRQFWHLSFPGGEVRKLTSDLSSYEGVSLTADSSALITVQADPSLNIWVAPQGETGRATSITSGTGKDEGRSGLAWTADGKVVYYSNVSGQADLWIMDADGSNQKQLTFNAGSNFSPVVSSDGRYIVFISTRTGSPSIWRIDITGDNAKQITTDSPSYPHLALDGNWVIYGRATSGRFTLWKAPVEGGDSAQLTDNLSGTTSCCPALSRDGQWIAYFALGSTAKRIAVIPASGGPPTKTLDYPPTITWGLLRWTPDGKALGYIDTRAGVSNLWALPVDGSPPKQITDFKTDQIFWFDWSRDGRWLALARGSVSSDVVLVRDSR
jgi:eukaryotic-like serine/threonine-protein kinase